MSTMLQCVLSKGGWTYGQGSGPNIIYAYIVTTLKETMSHFCDALEMWIISNSVEIKGQGINNLTV